jgi:anti-sigma B factor antagonist
LPVDGDVLDGQRRPGDGEVVLELRGEIDLATAPRQLADVQRLAPNSRVALDCSQVTFMDSSGVTMLILASRRSFDGGGTLRIVSPSPMVRRLLDISGLSSYFRVP